MAILPLIWANREIILKGIAVALIAFVAWYFFYHNPKRIKALENEKAELSKQVAARDAAINMLGDIEREHEIINRTTFRIISSIRYLPKPSRDGMFYSNADPYGMSQAMPKYSTATRGTR